MSFLRTLARPALIATLATFTLSTCLAGTALACGGEWYPEVQIDPRIKGVDDAEKAFESGRELAAAGSVIRMIPHIKQLSPTKVKLIRRAHRVLAVATARHGGALPLEREVPSYAQGTFIGRTSEERRANLEWAVKTLRELAKTKKDDPESRTELGEALAQLDDTRGEARTLLEDLAARDLITSPEGYRALAELRAAAGDSKGRIAALDRCRAMARTESSCDATPSHST
jgi:predicted Zn-dependent protease